MRSRPDATATERPRPAWRVAFAGLLALAMALGSWSSFAIGALAPFIVDDLGLSRAALGSLTTAVFVTAALGSPVAGPIVDALGGRRMLMSVFGIAAVTILAMGVAQSYPWLVVAAAGSGIATSIMNPATNQLISSHIPRGGQGVILGVKQSGVQLALFATGLALPTLALLIGWRGAIIFSGVPALAGLFATPLLIRRPAGPATPRGQRPRLGRHRVVSRLTAYAFLMGFASAAVTTYLVLFGVESIGLPEAAAGLASALLGLMGVISRVLWARQAERMSSAALPLALLALAGVACVGLIWTAQAGAVSLFWLGAGGFGATASAWNSVGNLVLVRELPLAVAGRASGVMQVGFYGGFVASPIAFGSLVDATGSYGPSWTAVALALALAGLLAWTWERQRRRARVDHSGEIRAREREPAGAESIGGGES